MDLPPPTPEAPEGAAANAGDGVPVRAGRRARLAGRPGVAGRLMIAVLLPLTGLAITASVLLSERYHSQQEAKGIAAQIPALTGIVRIRTLLDQERMAAEGGARAAELGVHLPSAVTGLGFAFEPLGEARAALDAQVRAMAGALPRDFADGLRAVRAQVDAGQLGARALDQSFARLSAVLAAVFADRTATLERRLADTSRAAALVAAIRTLGEANDVLEANATETADVSDVYFDGTARRAADLSALGGQIALLAGAGGRLSADGAEPVRAAFAKIEDSPSWQQFHEVATAAAAGSVSGPIASHGGAFPVDQAQVIPLVAVFASGLTGIRQLYRLVGQAESHTHEVASTLEASSRDGFRNLLIETIIGIGLTILAVLLIARSISRPLRRLEEHARAISGGDIELPRLDERGPRETVVATRAFNDLVSNLHLLEAKMRLLADCSFTDPMLERKLPGRLGHALEQSIEVLSGSIVERDGLQQRLVHQATHDGLTGLHNRAAAVEFLDQAIARTARSSEGLAVFFIDLDDFKRANDTHGHAIGDAILREIARRISRAARETDFVARLGGDEFLVIAEGLADGGQAAATADRLVHAVGAPISAGGVQVSVGARVGIAFALDGTADESSQLLARADLALYRAKQANSSVEIYDESLQHALIARAEVERDLTAALDEGGAGLSLHYQPVIDAVSGELLGAEALVRWQRPGRGACMPDEFIPAAEASDLIVGLDRWVLTEALSQQCRWRRAGANDVGVSVNISGRHLLSGELPQHVAAALAQTGADPSGLTLELTETVLLTDLPAVGMEMDRLRSLGVKVSIDDFGTGFTSLAHLQHLTVDEIKIDRSYVQQLPEGRDSALVRLVTQAGHHLGVSIVAEGVETDEQLAALREIGCDSLQGYRIARPLEAERFGEWWQARSRNGATPHAAAADAA